MFDKEAKEKLKETLKKDNKVTDEEIDMLLNTDTLFNNNFGLWALMLLALLFTQPSTTTIPPLNININTGSDK